MYQHTTFQCSRTIRGGIIAISILTSVGAVPLLDLTEVCFHNYAASVVPLLEPTNITFNEIWQHVVQLGPINNCLNF